ncbi:MAG: right-handed parallel beta-helix repeat-containing protein [Nitriliruptorales bacterium]|nr:right-handed parallel beta-helix repeat-containing protein [Nitriliruptorales bacterium]
MTADAADKGDGTDRRPFRLIQHALERAEPGDVIVLADGVYHQNIRSVRSGEPAAPITIQGSGGAVVHGDGSSGRIVEINHDHLVLDGFTVDGLVGDPSARSSYRDKLVYVTPTEPGDYVIGCKILNLRLRNAGGEGVRLKLSKDCEIANNVITNVGVYDFQFAGGGKNGEGIYIGTSPRQLDWNPDHRTDDSSRIHVHHNFIDTNANEGVNSKEGTHDLLIEFNTVTGQRDEDAAAVNIQGDHTVVRFNELRNNRGAGVRLGEGTPVGDGTPRGRHNSVYGNVLHDNAHSGVKIMADPQELVCGNLVSGTSPAVRGVSSFDPTAPCPATTPTSPTVGHDRN